MRKKPTSFVRSLVLQWQSLDGTAFSVLSSVNSIANKSDSHRSHRDAPTPEQEKAEGLGVPVLHVRTMAWALPTNAVASLASIVAGCVRSAEPGLRDVVPRK